MDGAGGALVRPLQPRDKKKKWGEKESHFRPKHARDIASFSWAAALRSQPVKGRRFNDA